MGTSLGDKIAIVIALLLLAVGGVMIVEFPGIIRAAKDHRNIGSAAKSVPASAPPSAP
jgi:hypothetical protein